MPQGAGSLPGFPSSFDKADVFRLSVNPAFLPFAKKMSGGITIEKPWSTKELNFLHVQFLTPWRSMGISFGLTHFGNKEYRRNRLDLYAGKKLGKLHVGMGLTYAQIVYEGYGKESQIEINAGMLLELNEQTSYFNNIRIGTKNGERDGSIGQVINGLEYRVSDQVCIGLAAIRNKGSSMICQFNCIYQPVKQVDIDIGMVTGISTVYVCVKYRLKNISVRSGFRFGQFIGVVPAIGVMVGNESE
jgi:hypothetical protein